MKKIKPSRLFGLGGVALTESARAQAIGKIFEWYLLCIAFWLPIQWYLQVINRLTYRQIVVLDWFIWLSFLAETLLLLCLVKRRWYYLRGNWLNLVIIIVICPLLFHNVAGLGALRLVRLLILVRIIVPWVRNAHSMLTLNRLGMTLVVFFVATTLSGIIIATIDSGISNPFEGIWWAWETVTTVGYGDVVPTTLAGKVIAMIIMVMGIGLLSVLTATMSAYFVGRDKEEDLKIYMEGNRHRLERIEAQLKHLDKRLMFHDEASLDHFVGGMTSTERDQLLQVLQRHRLKEQM